MLSQSSNRISGLLSLENVYHIVLNASFHIEYLNQNALKFLADSEARIIGKNWLESYIPAKIKKTIKKGYQQLKANGTVNKEIKQYPIINGNAEEKVFFWQYTLLSSSHIALIGQSIPDSPTNQDITERSSNPNPKSDEKYRNLFDYSNDSIVLHDLEGNILDVNTKALEQFGYNNQEMLSLNISDLHSENQIDLSRKLIKKIAKDGFIRFEIDFKKKDGEIFSADVSSSIYESGSTKIVQGIIRDITERKKVEETIKESEEKYRSFVEEDLTADYISTPDGQIMYCNPAFLEIFKFKSLEHALQTNTTSLYEYPEDRFDLLSKLKEGGKLVNYEMRLRTRDGESIHVIANIIGKFSESGALTEIKGYLYDITEHKKMEKQFWQAQKMEAVGRLAGGVAHDFNNILSVITGYSDLLLHKLHSDDPIRKDIEMIQKAGDRAGSLVRQLLAFSRRQVLQPKILNLNSLLHDLEKMLHRLIGEDIRLITKTDKALGAIKADPSQIEQVIMNLAVNARDAMPDGGQLTIETKNITLKQEMVEQQVTMKAGPYVLLSISDTGSGMDSETQVNIFEPFFTTKEKGKGTGLGLSTVYGIVKQSEGYIWVYSEQGTGTTFKIYLPVVKEAIEKFVKEVLKPETLRGGETILLVEDNDAVREVAEVILKEYGYNVMIAGNGEEALTLAEKHTENIDLLITDVVMPGISGQTLAERAAPSHQEMKVLYFSGYTEDAIVHRGILNSNMKFLQKPFGTEDLLRKVREVLDTPDNDN